MAQADTLPANDADLSLDFLVEEQAQERLSVATAFWVIAGLSLVLWAAIVSLVSAFS